MIEALTRLGWALLLLDLLLLAWGWARPGFRFRWRHANIRPGHNTIVEWSVPPADVADALSVLARLCFVLGFLIWIQGLAVAGLNDLLRAVLEATR